MRKHGRHFVHLLVACLVLLTSALYAQTTNPELSTTDSIRSIVSAGHLASLRWQDFSDVQPYVEAFYKESDNSPAWLQASQLSTRGLEMIRALEHAEREGLQAEDYDGPRWQTRIEQLAATHTGADEASFDVALTVCAMRYLSAVRIGRLNPQRLSFGFTVENRKLQLADFLRNLLTSSRSVDEEVADIEPPFAAYKRTHEALLRFIELAKQQEEPPLPPSIGVVERHGFYDHEPELAQRLRQLGSMAAGDSTPNRTDSYDDPLVGAVRNFQQTHGLPPTGNLDQKTIDELNVPLRQRLEQLGFTLERYRWISYDFSRPPIVVNLPEFRLVAYDDDDQVALSMRVIVGDAYDSQTPTLQSSIEKVIFRPYWYVPLQIFRTEMLNDIVTEPQYIKLHNMEVIRRNGSLVTSAKVSHAVLKQLDNGVLVARQKPGPENALGLLKIDFPSEHQVYLHDTPVSMHLFSTPDSDVSHGCIHLERPAELAHWLLRDMPAWTEERVRAAMESGENEFVVPLSQPVPILILYVTAYAESNGQVHFLPDIYKRDAVLRETLAKGYPYN